jgi:hypothetical protein
MTVRAVVGLAWSLVLVLAGGWLVLSPWSLAQQQGGDWTTLTKNEVGTGLGLILFGLLGIVLVGAQVVRSLRQAGVMEPRPRTRRGASATAASPEMEKALVALAQALAQDLDQRRGQPQGQDRQPTGQPVSAPWREQP